jgi:hypothetical protein
MPKLSSFNLKLAKAIASPSPSKEPYISINKLAEYMEANSIRRRAIIKSLKEDVAYKKVRYMPVRAVFYSYFNSGYDTSIIDAAVTKLRKATWANDHEKGDIQNSILALQSLKDVDLPNIEDYSLTEEIVKIDDIKLGGVKVTLKPEIYLMNKFTKKVGAFKIHLAKTEDNRLNHRSRQFAATLLKYGYIINGVEEKAIDDNFCISLDIFLKEYSFSPRAFKRDVDALTSSCEEIAARWVTL